MQNHEESAPLPIRESIQELEQELNEQIIGNEYPEIENQAKRGPGRPLKIKTGRSGRPRKQYQMIHDNILIDEETQPNEDIPVDGNYPIEENRENEHQQNEDENYEWHDAELAMSASEIPFSQAIAGPDRLEWREAIYSEIKSLIANDTWEIVKKPVTGKIIGSRTVLRNKYMAEGNLERRKARVVAQGFTQRPGIDFHDTFAPVARLGSLRLLMALAARTGMRISQLDVTIAYLNGQIDTEIFMQKPQLLEEMLKRIVQEEKDAELLVRAKNMLQNIHGGHKVCKLKKAIYGLRQAGRQWHAELNKTLLKIGLIPTNADSCVYVDKNKQTYVLVYVDDMLIISNDKERERQIKSELSKAFTIKDLGEAKYCLGIEIDRTRERLCLSQPGYIRDILIKFGMSDSKPVSTPLALGAKLSEKS